MIEKMEKIEISHKTIIFTIFFLIFLWFLFQVREIILIIFVAFVMMAALNPIVDRMEKLQIPRPLAILIIYLAIIGVFSGLVALIIPILVQQTSLLLANLPNIIEKLSFFNFQLDLNNYSSQIAKIPGNVFRILAVTFSNFLKFFTFLVITFYLLLERKNLNKHLKFLFAKGGEKKAEDFIKKLEKQIGGWVRGELILMFIVGFLSYLGLLLLDLEFALPLAVLAGFLEIIPNIGPTVSMVPAVIVGLSVSPIMGLTVVVLYFLIQQLENNLIVPKVMQKSVGLHPLVTLIVLMVGLKLGGAFAMILSIPIFLSLKTILKEVFHQHF